jgi:hypothetical protein
MKKLKDNNIIDLFIKKLNSFRTQNQNIIDLNNDFLSFRSEFDKRIFSIDNHKIEIKFTEKQWYRNS